MRKESDITSFFNCLICKEDKKYCSIGSCVHHKICLYCTMKSRLLYNESKCPICNTKLDHVFILDIQNLISPFQLEQNKEDYYEDDEFLKCGIYYVEIQAKEEALRLRGFNCPIKTCRSEAFENMQSLHLHLNRVHKRFYCDCCLKENKKFLSEMEIYNQDQLIEHIEYGQYSNGSMISPPHPQCPFDAQRFYNDEFLFKHMNQNHFICQLCKNSKNIIFYSLLDNLLEHFKANHFCCPFPECIEDFYVVFPKEEELVTHLITKHKMVNANERLTQIILDNKQGNQKGNKKIHSKDEFNFSKYISKLKEKCDMYRDLLSQNKKYIYTMEEESIIGEDGIEYIIQYRDDKYYKKGKGKFNNKKIERYTNYNNNNKDFNKYDNNKYQQNKKNFYNNQYSYSNNSLNNNTLNFPIQNDNNSNNTQSLTPLTQQKNENIDYSFILNFYLKCLKEYLKKKILVDKVREDQFNLPKETIYQLIMVIDKRESNQKLLELAFLKNFGIDMEINRELKELFCSGVCNETNLFDILNGMTIKKILIIYKYVQISTKKADNLFYKLDLEQIDNDLYEEFVERKKNEKDSFEKREKKMEFINQFNFTPTKISTNNKESQSINNKSKSKKCILKENDFQPKKQSKLAMLLNDTLPKEDSKKKIKKKNKPTTFNISDFNLDIDFPAFH